jgi:hypothetical protein
MIHKRGILLIAALVLLGFFPILAAEEASVDIKPMKFGTYTTYGIINGSPIESYGGGPDPIDNQAFTRVAVWMMSQATVNERLNISAGVGGLFWYSAPVVEGLPHTRIVKFGPGINLAAGVYNFGDPESPFLKLHMGLFPHKYNPDTKNLGEYLFRSGTYPGYLWTGGWSILNSAGYLAKGIRTEFSFLENSLKLDGTFYVERDIEPSFDISPGLLISYNIGNIFEIGGGIVFSHLISSDKEKVTPKKRENSYFLDTELYNVAPSEYYLDTLRNTELPVPQIEWNKPGLEFYGIGDPRSDTLVVLASDPRAGTRLPQTDPRYKELEDENIMPAYYSIEDNGIPESMLNYYTFNGQKIMGRISLKPQGFLQSDILGPDDLNLYAEVSLLGVKDYPFFYDKKSERMPIMIGFNLPGFKFIDIISLEVEYIKTRFRNHFYTSFDKVIPIWTMEEDAGEFIDSNLTVTDNEWFWTLYVKKTVMPHFVILGQIAHDHLRTFDYWGNPNYEPFSQKGPFNDWYWAIRAEFGI